LRNLLNKISTIFLIKKKKKPKDAIQFYFREFLRSVDLAAGRNCWIYLSSILTFRHDEPIGEVYPFDLAPRNGLPSSRRALILYTLENASKLMRVEYGDMRSSMRFSIRRICRPHKWSRYPCTVLSLRGSYRCRWCDFVLKNNRGMSFRRSRN